VLTIVDTSVAVKWFISEDEPKRKEALAVLKNLCADPHQYAVPELFFNEMLAVFCRLLSDVSEIKEYMHILEQLGFERLGNGSQLLGKAAEISKKYNISGYDAVFAAAAFLVKGAWLTADEVAVRKMRGQTFIKLL
jgi:predicted nucleic acid-binding protein